MAPVITRSMPASVARAAATALGGARLPWEADEGGTAPDPTPATIFAGSNLLWIDALGGAYLRDGGGAVPDNGEVVATAIGRGTVGDSASAGGAGLTYDATAFGNRGGLAFAGGATDYLLSPSWTLASRCSGIIVWRATSGGARGSWGHGATNTRISQFWNANLSVARRIDGALGLDCSFAMLSATNSWSSFTLENSAGTTWGPGGLSGTSAVAASIPGTAAQTTIGALNAGVAPFVGIIGEFVLADVVMSTAQRTALQAYVVARWGLTA